jgi:NAD(P)-dependent dehydrogenase (short-subunit alcohol dehydrogenase family)
MSGQGNRSRRFEGKVALVTGGSNGIGEAVVRRLREEGAQVAVADLEEPAVEATADLLFCRGDIEDEAFCASFIAAAHDRFGRVDYLVNNAFAFTAKGADATAEDWRHSFGVGPIGFARMIQGAGRLMIAEGGGAVVNVSSISAHVAQAHRWTYNMAKGAVAQLTRCAALDLARHNIRVNSVSPGWIWTREVQKAADLDGGGRAKWEPVWGAYHMLKRCGEPDEVARPILFLLSDEASFITGTDLAVDAGYLSMGPEGLGETAVIAGSD